MFQKVLIANRGEIAVRIIKTCKRLGIKTVAVFSDVDFRSLHVREADEAVNIGPNKPTASYLDMGKIIAAALQHNCQAIHPGYGFLSESAVFAELVSQAGLVFVGPSAPAIATLGNKIASKILAIKAGLPVVPGYSDTITDMTGITSVIETIGYPLLLKPAAGGGGRGMRIVTGHELFTATLKTCQEETRKAFGDDKVFLERYISNPRHIEIQIMADHHGRIIYLGERECSIQRRYQKIIEETPSPAVDESLRRRLGTMACDLAREVGYTNAGTVEFILDQEGNVFFIEMNTRLQVEHPITELVTALDLVELQLRIAADEPLPISQEEVVLHGWAMEARICAEDTSRGFLPTTGIISRYTAPRGRNIRVDSGIEAGSTVGIYYDSLLAKVAAWGETREEARRSLVHGLNGYHIEGVITNLDFANAVLNHPSFVAGSFSTAFIDEHCADGQVQTPPCQEHLISMMIAATLVYHNRANLVRSSLKPMVARVGGSPAEKPWHHYMVRSNNDMFKVRLHGDHASSDWTVVVNDKLYQVVTPEFEFYRRRLKLNINGESHLFRLEYRGNFMWSAFCGITRVFEIYSPLEWELAQYMPKTEKMIAEAVLRCPMPGLVIDVMVGKGERVYHGQELVIIESMKMESGIASPSDGVVEEIKVRVGQAVETDEILLTFKS